MMVIQKKKETCIRAFSRKAKKKKIQHYSIITFKLCANSCVLLRQVNKVGRCDSGERLR